MGQILHGSAKTTHAVRALIQRSKASKAALSRQLGINIKTVAKWRRRNTVEDAPMGSKQVRSTVLTIEEEAAAVAFRRHALLPLDDCLLALPPSILKLTRSSLHHRLQRHGISRTRALTCTSILPKGAPGKGKAMSSSPSTELQNSPMSDDIGEPGKPTPLTSDTCWDHTLCCDAFLKIIAE